MIIHIHVMHRETCNTQGVHQHTTSIGDSGFTPEFPIVKRNRALYTCWTIRTSIKCAFVNLQLHRDTAVQ